MAHTPIMAASNLFIIHYNRDQAGRFIFQKPGDFENKKNTTPGGFF
jgi:hypothetical protein